MKNSIKAGLILIAILGFFSCEGEFQENEDFIDQFFPINGETCQEGLALPPNQVYIPIRWKTKDQFQSYSLSLKEISNTGQETLTFDLSNFITLDDGSLEAEVVLNLGNLYKGVISGQSSSGNFQSNEFEFTTAFVYENTFTLPPPATIEDPFRWEFFNINNILGNPIIVEVNWYSDDIDGIKGYRYDVYLDRTNEDFKNEEVKCPVNQTFFKLIAQDLDSTSIVLEDVKDDAIYALQIITRDRRLNESSSCITFEGRTPPEF